MDKNFQVYHTCYMIHNGRNEAGNLLIVDDTREHETGYISKAEADRHAAAGRGEFVDAPPAPEAEKKPRTARSKRDANADGQDDFTDTEPPAPEAE